MLGRMMLGRMMVLRMTVLAILAFATGGSAAAQDVELHVSADSVSVGQRFVVSVTARHEYAASPVFPAPDTASTFSFGDVDVLAVRAHEQFSRDGLRVDSIVYEVTTFALDTARVAAVPVLFSAGEDTFTVHTEPTWLPVVSLVPDDAEDVRDLAPLVEFPAPIWPYLAAAAALLLLALLVALYVRRRRASAPPPPPPPPAAPDREALDRLEALERVDLTDPDNVQPFYDELSGLLRTYFARRLHVHAMEMTTREMIRELQRGTVPGADTSRRLQEVLTAADLVKFADASPPSAQGRELISTSRSIVRAVEHQLQPREVESSDAPALQ